MSLNIMVSGELVRAPVRKLSQKGNRPFVTAAMTVHPSDSTRLLVGIVAFGQAADVLEGCNVGDAIAASGPARPNRWRGSKQGQLTLQLLAEHVTCMHPTGRDELEGNRLQHDVEQAATP